MELPDLRFSRDFEAIGDDARRLRREAARGRLVRPHRGAFVDAGVWTGLTQQQRYRTRVAAAAAAARVPPVVSHLSAAAIWGAPVIGHPPSTVDVLATIAAGSRTEHGFRKHATAFTDEVEVVAGVAVTPLVRTLADVALTAPFVTAVGVLDWALGAFEISPDDIRGDLDRRGIVRGRRRAERAIDFADGRSGSAGESLSRVRIQELGFPPPELQCPFTDRAGLIGIVDFWWPAYRLIGEFDGLGKYVREAFTAGRTTAEVVLDEKRRENRLRAVPPGLGVARWEWADAWRGPRLADILSSAGLPSSRRR